MGASITVDIKAQITGYLELIEKIKAEMKKIDPGSSIGKGLTKSLTEAERKLSTLTRDAEKRITSLGQLDSLFDRLHLVHDLVLSMGLGLSNVGLNDVLVGASELARALALELLQVKTEMNLKGASFFDELKKTNPKELLTVFDLLKFDPKTMGIDEFVSRFKEATDSAEKEINELTEKLLKALDRADAAARAAAIRNLIPDDLRYSSLAKLRVNLGVGKDNFLTKVKNELEVNAKTFIEQLQAELNKDLRSNEDNEALSAALKLASDSLLKAQSDSAVKDALSKLNDVISARTLNDALTQNKDIATLTGGMNIDEWVQKIGNKASADLEFINKVEALAQALSTDSSTSDAGNKISEILLRLLDPTLVNNFKTNMSDLVGAVLDGMRQLNSISKEDPGKTQGIADSLSAELTLLKEKFAAMDTVKNSPAYEAISSIINNLESRIIRIEELLLIELNKNGEAAAGGARQTGRDILGNMPKMANDAANSIKLYSSALEDVSRREQMVGKVEGIAQRWFSVYAAVRMIGKAFNSVKLNVQGLDKTITEIAIVTDMSQSDLWGLMPEYTAMARKYGATLLGVYEVSQLYYQQGLEQDDVMALTEQTLKMARISGLDYGEATNYMTNAIRSFKIEMLDAQRVVDVYSALAASSASSTSELATAMSKTASSAAAVGSSFEATSAMMAVMIETTRESPENIGSALKSIISRYGELKENKTGIDEEGEEYSLNKVDTALLSVGISIHDAKGEFRDFDDVIMELAQSWDTIDTNTLRYIATVMAGNRQQSRFLALVSNGKRLAELNETAESSEDASTLQVLKTMDSIDYKSLQLLTTLLSLYTSTGIETFYKGILDGANLLVETFTLMPTLFNLPIPALMSVATNFISLANIVMTTLSVLKQKFVAQWDIDNEISDSKDAARLAARLKREEETNAAITASRLEAELLLNVNSAKNDEQRNTAKTKMKTASKWALGALVAGTGLNLASGLISDKGTGNRAAKASLGIAGSTLQYGALGFLLTGSPVGAVAGALLGGLMGAWLNLSYIWESTADRAKRLKEEAEEALVTYKLKDATARNIEKELASVKKLSQAQYDSVEARKQFVEASNKLGADMPELVSAYDSEGNAIIDLSNAYALLALKRREANEAGVESAEKSLETAAAAKQDKLENLEKVIEMTLGGGIDFSKLSAENLYNYHALLATAEKSPGHLLNLDNTYNDLAYAEQDKQSLASIAKIALSRINEETTPYLYKLLGLLTSTQGRAAVGHDLITLKSAFMGKWKTELGTLTDSVTSLLMGFIIDFLDNETYKITQASGELVGAEASERSILLSEVAKAVEAYRLTQADIVNYNTTDLNMIVAAQKNLDLFQNLNNANEIISNYIMSQFIDSKLDWKTFLEAERGGFASARDTIMETLALIPATAYDSINKLFLERDKYTQGEFLTLLQLLISDPTAIDAIMLSLISYYKTMLDSTGFAAAVQLRNADQERQLKFDINSLIYKNDKNEALFSGKELLSILAMWDKINSMYEHGSITKSSGEAFLQAYTELWNGSSTAVLSILTSITDFSEESLLDILDVIDDSSELTSEEKTNLKKDLPNLFKLVPQNINTALATYESALVEAIENYNKDMSAATKGMDPKAMMEMAEKLKIKPTAEYFDIKDGQAFLKDTLLLADYYFGENGISEALSGLITETSTKMRALIEQLNELAQLTEEIKLEDLDEKGIDIDLNTIQSFIKDFKDSDLSEITDQYIQDYFDGKIKNAEEFFELLKGSSDLKTAIDSGKFKNIVEAGLSDELLKLDNYSAILSGVTGLLSNALKTGNFSELLKNDKLSQEFKNKLPEMKVAYDEALQSLLSGFVDSISDGYKIIEINDYNRDLFESILSLAKHLISSVVEDSQGQVVSAVIDLTTKDIDEVYNIIASQEVTAGSAAQQKLRELLQKLKGMLYESSRAGTLSTIVDSYNKVSMTAYEEFKDVWKDAPVQALFKQLANGSYKANLPLLAQFARQQYSTLDEMTRLSIEETLVKAIDDGATMITHAAEYTTKGTTRYLDMADFVKQFNEISTDADISITDAFKYDTNLRSYTLDTKAYLTYLLNEALVLSMLGLDTSFITGLLNDNTKVLAEAIDILGFLDAEDKSAGSHAYKTLQTSLSNYITSNDELFNRLKSLHIAENLSAAPEDVRRAVETGLSGRSIADFYISQIKLGGMKAINVLQAVAKALGRELTAKEVEAAYLTLVHDLETALDQLTYGVGSLVSGQAVNLLRKAGYELLDIGGGSAVITSIGELSNAYEAYYDALKNSNEATLAALNEAKAKVLETKFGRAEELIAIDTLGDATGMTYSTFAEIFTNVGMELTDDMMKQMTEAKVIESMGGNKLRIKDFSRFAQAMHWDYNSEEYISAFKSYNDGLIELNKKAQTNITEELKGLEEAKPGDWINFTNLSLTLSNAITDTYIEEIGDISGHIRPTEIKITALESLNQLLFKYGASLENGILKLSDNANLLGIAESIKQVAAEANLDLTDGFKELADVIQSILKSYVEAILKGITGGLTNVEAADLKLKALDLGVLNIDFKDTTNGLQLSELSAIRLYTALKRIDGLQASLIFNDLKESLEAANENFDSVSSLTSYIVETRRALNEADSNVSDARLSLYLSELAVAQEILAVRSTLEDNSFNFMSNDIPAALKNPLNYAKNWTEALHKIRDAWDTTKVTKGSVNGKGGVAGFIDYEDYYNIVTELNNVAGISGQLITIGHDIKGNALSLDGSLEAASAAIQAGCDSLTTVDTGDLKVNLGAIGLNIESGAADMQNSVTQGILAAAHAQVEMLDGLIAMLELIVAMEKLGDITGEDTTIDLGDIFTVSGLAATEENLEFIDGYTKKFDAARKKLVDYLETNTDAKHMFEHAKLGLGGEQFNLYDLLNKDFEETFGKMSNEDRARAATSFLGILDSFYQAAISGDYDLNNIAESVKNIMKRTGVDLENFVFEFTDENNKVTRVLTFMGETVVDIDFTDESTRQAFDKYFNTSYAKDEEGYRNYIQEQLKTYLTKREADTLTYEELLKIRTELGVASNEFVLRQDTGTGKYVGYYEGQKFLSADANMLIKEMGRAALFKDKGYGFTVLEDEVTGDFIKLVAKTTIGGTEVEVDFNDKTEPVYSYGGYKNLTEDLIKGLLAKEGKYDTGGTFEFEDSGKKYTSTVQYSLNLDLSYSWVVEDGKEPYLMYLGHQFKDWNLLQKFDSFKDKMDPLLNGLWKDNKYVTTLNVNGELRITSSYDVTTDTTTMTIGNDTFTANTEKAPAMFAQYMELAQKDNFKDITAESVRSGYLREIEYNYGKMIIHGKIGLASGETEYTYTDGAGNILGRADSAEALEYVIDKFNTDAISTKLSGKHVTYTIAGYEVELIIDAEGKISLANPAQFSDGVPQVVQEAIDAANKKTTTTLENPVEAKADKIKVVTEGAEAELDAETIQVKEAVDIEVKAQNITVDTSGAAEVSAIEVTAPSVTVHASNINVDDVVLLTQDAVAEGLEKGALPPAALQGAIAVTGGMVQEYGKHFTQTLKDAWSAASDTLHDYAQDIKTTKSVVDQTTLSVLSYGNTAITSGEAAATSASSAASGMGEVGSAIGEAIALLENLITLWSSFGSMSAELDIESIHTMANSLMLAATTMSSFSTGVGGAIASLSSVMVSNTPVTALPVAPELSTLTQEITFTANDDAVKDAISALDSAVAETRTIQIDANSSAADQKLAALISRINAASGTVQVSVNVTGVDQISTILTAINNLQDKTVTVTVKESVSSSGGTEATGNFGLAHAKSTLMGELGPELVVSNNRYFVAGLNGPEFVDLAKDAIVFNHLQTQLLLKNGMSPSRGLAITNERNAVAYAKGSLSGGPAMASASAALAALKQLRAQWAALEKMSVLDFAGKGGSGGGGGGGGGKDKKTEAFIKNLDRWYKLLLQIARLEKDINREEERRNTIAAASTLRPEGDKYFLSQAHSLELLKKQRDTQLLLANEQKAYFKELQEYYEKEGAFSALYSFDDYGQLTYRDGAYEKLAKLFGVNELGKANYTVELQYEQLVAMGYGDLMIYDTSGNEIDRSEEGWQKTAVQTLWDKMEAEREEMQSLYDSYNEKEAEALQSLLAMDEIISEMRDNLIDLEKKVLNAVVELRERAIDLLEEEKDAIESASNNMINGLTELLEKERDMYQHLQASDELGRLLRQLGILLRSGGSGSLISSLRSQIKDKTLLLYFDTQLELIDALQEAVDTLIDRLNEQIDLMKEELEYEKEHGLLWNEVKEIMKNNPEDITQFIMENTEEYWGLSSDEFEKNMASNLYSAQQWTAWRDNTWSDGERKNLLALVDHFVPVIDDIAEGATALAEEETTESSETTTTTEDELARREREARERLLLHGPSEEEIERIRREAEQAANRKGLLNAIDSSTSNSAMSAVLNLMSVGEARKLPLHAVATMFDTGGMVDEDKFALVHAKEAVLTPEQTKMFREDLLGQSSNSVLRQLQTLRDEWSQQVHDVENTLSTFASLYHLDENGLSYNPLSSGFSVWIENAAVNMNVEKLANDYDAQRAGEQALEKMLQIARKTSGWNRIGG